MDVTVTQEALLAALRKVEPFLTSFTGGDVWLRADGTALTLHTTDGVTTAAARATATVTAEGDATLPGRFFAQYVAALPAGVVRLTAERGGRLRLVQGRRVMHLAGSWTDRPAPRDVTDGVTLTLAAPALRDAMGAVRHAAARSDDRPVLTGVLLETCADRVLLAAADGYRLAYTFLPADAPPPDLRVVLPSSLVRALDRLLADETGNVALSVSASGTLARLSTSTVEVVTALLHQTKARPYPDVLQLVPAAVACSVRVDAGELRQVVRMVALYAREGAGIVRLLLTPGDELGGWTLRLSSRADEYGDQQAELDVQVEGDAQRIAINAAYLSDALAVLRGPITLGINAPNLPLVLRSESEPGGHVLMPMFVHWDGQPLAARPEEVGAR